MDISLLSIGRKYKSFHCLSYGNFTNRHHERWFEKIETIAYGCWQKDGRCALSRLWKNELNLMLPSNPKMYSASWFSPINAMTNHLALSQVHKFALSISYVAFFRMDFSLIRILKASISQTAILEPMWQQRRKGIQSQLVWKKWWGLKWNTILPIHFVDLIERDQSRSGISWRTKCRSKKRSLMKMTAFAFEARNTKPFVKRTVTHIYPQQEWHLCVLDSICITWYGICMLVGCL